MTTKILLAILLLILIVRCSDEKASKKVGPSVEFTTYEVSFTDGGGTNFSLSVDTSKIFLAAHKFDTLSYGILPDSIFGIINKNAFALLNDKSIANTNKECYDCPSLSILVTLSKDTVRLVQKGDVSAKTFSPLLEVLEHFLKSNNYSGRKALLYPQLLFETKQAIMPPPPPPRVDNK